MGKDLMESGLLSSSFNLTANKLCKWIGLGPSLSYLQKMHTKTFSLNYISNFSKAKDVMFGGQFQQSKDSFPIKTFIYTPPGMNGRA